MLCIACIEKTPIAVVYINEKWSVVRDSQRRTMRECRRLRRLRLYMKKEDI